MDGLECCYKDIHVWCEIEEGTKIVNTYESIAIILLPWDFHISLPSSLSFRVCQHPPPCIWLSILRACSHGGGGPQVGEVPRLGGVTNLSIQSLFFSWLLSHERWGTSPRRVARSAVPGNPLRWGKCSSCECWRWGGVMFSWAFIHYKTNWNADRTAKKC